MADIEALAKARNRLRAEVVHWINEQGKAGRLRANREAPMWGAYEEAEDELATAITEVGM